MKEEAKALRTILTAVRLEDPIESLKLYSAAVTISEGLESELEAKKLPEFDYILEKLGLFVSYLQYAVMPVEGEAVHSPQGWLQQAGINLSKVEISLR